MNIPELSTPKNRRSAGLATSTVDRSKKPKPRPISEDLSTHFESSLGIISLNNINLSNIVSPGPANIDQILQQQRQLASTSLNRVSKLSGIPSRLLKPDFNDESDTCNIPFESTVNESDLIPAQNPIQNTSTPRSSSAELDLQNSAGPRESIFSRFRDMLDSDVKTDKVVEEFKQVVQANNSLRPSTTMDSCMFIPAEEAASRFLADEISWKKKYDMPLTETQTSFQQPQNISSMSIGEFFQRGSDDISDLKASSPTKTEPVALIDITEASNDRNSLSISAIQQLLTDNQHTPGKVMDYLFNQNGKSQRIVNRESSDVFSLPVSRDTSYTTSFSDNEAVRVAVRENKENVHPLPLNKNATKLVPKPSPEQNKFSSSPSRSTSSLTSLIDGKLPIESNVIELVWGCVRVDRGVFKQFMVRNKSSKTLRLQCSISSLDFKIRKDNRSESDHLSACKFVLHSHESRALVVSFIPTKIGPCVDELCFTPLDSNLKQTKKQCVRLWGYGGSCNCEYQGVTRDNTGKYWMTLGRLDNRVLMEQNFSMKNNGNLPSFTYVKVVPKHITITNLRVEPNLFVLLPNEEKTVKISYTPNAKDSRVLKQNLNVLPVLDIGKLELVTGPEVSRSRLRRLYRKCLEKNLIIDELTKILVQKIPGEVTGDTIKFRESPGAIIDILETFSNDEVMITIEQDPNQTVVAEYPEDSAIYQSLCQTHIDLEDTVTSLKSCRLEPPSLVLFPPNKSEDCLFLISESRNSLHFEVTCNPKGLNIKPTAGVLNPGDTVEFKIKLGKVEEKAFKVMVYVEHDVFEAEVKVLNVKPSSRGTFLG